MTVTLQSQTPAQGGVLADPASYYEMVWFNDAGNGWATFFVQFTLPDTSVVNVAFGGAGAPSFAAGWEGQVIPTAGTLTVRVRPVGGWTPGGDYGAPPSDGRITWAGADTPAEISGQALAPQWDFTVAAGAPELEVLVEGPRRFELDASAWVGLSGALGRRDRVASVQRTGPGVYVVTFAPGAARALAEYHLSVTPLAGAARLATLTVQGELVTVRTFDAGGAPTDANFALAARRAS
jgi:hypothetical protein